MGTTTEIYDYLKLLFARIGKTYSPVSGELVKRHNVSDVMKVIHQLGEGTRFLITAPVTFNDRTALEHLSILSKQGFARILVNDAIVSIEDILEENIYTSDKIHLVVDRAVVAFIQKLREEELFKRPGLAETLDWAKCLVALDVVALSPDVITDTIGAVLKYQDDIAKITGGPATRILEQIRQDMQAL